MLTFDCVLSAEHRNYLGEQSVFTFLHIHIQELSHMVSVHLGLSLVLNDLMLNTKRYSIYVHGENWMKGNLR